MDGRIVFDIPGLKDIDKMSDEEKYLYDREVAERIAEQERKDRLASYRKSGIGERFFNESFDTYTARNEEAAMAKEIVMQYLNVVKQGKFRSLKLLGAVGNGKTHLAASLIREFGGMYRKASEIVNEYQSTKSFSANLKEKDLLEIYGSTKLLVIDEIGRSNNDKDEKYIIYEILNTRYETRKPTVLISNFTNLEFAEFTGEAVTDRLNEQAITIEFKSPSYRLNKRE